MLYIRKIRHTPALYYWVVRLQEGHQPLGILSFMKRSYLDHFDIGFAFLPQYQGQGYAFEAAKAVLDHAAGKPEYQPILATTLPANSRSIRLLNKLGLHLEREIEVDNNKLLVFSNATAFTGPGAPHEPIQISG